ncbi:MAG: hypothetical protein LBT26_01585 [Clostridiales Family XIII bacterium]|jgi:hypothetical protein|nr:hypothetical protein [Clostridiales Family XIII bacterium]
MPLLLIVVAVIAGFIYFRFIKQSGDPTLKDFSPAETNSPPGPDAARDEEPGQAAAAAQSADDAQAADATAQEVADKPAFRSMEELTEFYRQEAERITGIKH